MEFNEIQDWKPNSLLVKKTVWSTTLCNIPWLG